MKPLLLSTGLATGVILWLLVFLSPPPQSSPPRATHYFYCNNQRRTLAPSQESRKVQKTENNTNNLDTIQSTLEAQGPRINVNTASQQQLDSLPGIGPVIASRIIEYRSHHPFSVPKDLLKVKGIGPKKLEKIQEKICFK